MKFSELPLELCTTYAGIGSRETPLDVMYLMIKIATKLEQKGIILRSGGAAGADSAFANGVLNPSNKRIYLPWVGFNNNVGGVYMGSMMAEAEKIAKKYHPKWSRCGHKAKKLLTRNTFQILGDSLNDPSDFVICWTKDGKASGGTGQAVRSAKDLSIPIFNLQREDHRAQLEHFVSQTELPI